MVVRYFRAEHLIVIFVIVVAAILVLGVSVSILPAAPIGPTPTWPQGIDLPDKLPHLPH